MMDTSYGQGGFMKSEGGAKAGGGQDSGVKTRRNIAVVDIAQIRSLYSDRVGFVVHQHRVSNIVLVARLLNVDSNDQRDVYTVQDHSSGPIEVQVWKNDSGRNRVLENAVAGIYVKVFGNVRCHPESEDGKPNVFVGGIGVTEASPDDVTLHLIERLYSSMVLEKTKNNRLAERPSTYGFPSTDNKPDFLRGQPVSHGSSSGASGGQSLQAAGSGMTTAQDLVLKVISGSQAGTGIARAEIENSLKALSKDQITKALDFLSTEGHIYTTTDEDHFKSTDG